MKITTELKEILQKPEIKNAIDRKDFATVYKSIKGKFIEIPEFTNLCLNSGINPLEYMDYVPVRFAFGSLSIKNINFEKFTKITDIRGHAFSSCFILETLIISPNIKFISSYAFSNCPNLTTIIIDSKDLIMNEALFSACDKLKTIKFTGTMKQFDTICAMSNNWASGSPITKISCSDGVYEL